MTEQEINEAVAWKLGRKIPCKLSHASVDVCECGWNKGDELAARANGLDFTVPISDYCHSIAAAWEIVEDFIKQDFTVDLNYAKDCKWLFRVGSPGSESVWCLPVEADTAPMAICLAFLKLP